MNALAELHIIDPGRAYAARCAKAATDQGLDPLTAALVAAGIAYDVEQTGGFCMVVTVRGILDGDEGTFTLTATDEGARFPALPAGTWHAAFHPGNTWEEGDASGDYPDETTLTTTDLIARLTEGA